MDGLQIGEVSRVNGTAAWFSLPRLNPEQVYGPAEAAGLDLAAGDRVLVGFVEGRSDRPALIRRLP